MIDFERQRGARLQGALLDGAEMRKELAGLLLGVSDTEPDSLAGHHSGVADLASRFRIKPGLVKYDGAGLPRLQPFALLSVLPQRRHHASGGFGPVAQELGGAEFLAQRE